MKKTLETSVDISIHSLTKVQVQILVMLCKALGYDVLERNDYNEDNNVFGYDIITNQFMMFNFAGSKDKQMKFNEFVEFIDNPHSLIPYKMKLNEQYDALISEEGIQVGCQTISFEKLMELYKLSHEFLQKHKSIKK